MMSQAKESQVDDDDSGVTTYDLIEALQRMVMNSDVCSVHILPDVDQICIRQLLNARACHRS